MKTKRSNEPADYGIWAGGGGAIIEIRSWENELLHQVTAASDSLRFHHDVVYTEHGTVLAVAWELKSKEQAIRAGRSPELVMEEGIWPDKIIEYNGTLDSIIWEWSAWDHLVQDRTDTLDNYGIIENNPHLIDVNHTYMTDFQDWMHVNAIDYNSELDQIAISVPHFGEIWIIDHSTTLEEASGHSGGKGNKGGDLLYRWGNDSVVGKDADQKLFFAHDVHWIDDFIASDNPNKGKIAVFNNRIGSNFSVGSIFSPVFDTLLWEYEKSNDGLYLPQNVGRHIYHPDTFSLFSNAVSSIQVLENENIMLFAGQTGEAFEISPENEVVWEYKIPLDVGTPVRQFSDISRGRNFTFRFERYPPYYSAFEGRDLSPKGYLELEPTSFYCDSLITSNKTPDFEGDYTVFPNPINSNQFQVLSLLHSDKIELFDSNGTIIPFRRDGESFYLLNNYNGVIFIRINDQKLLTVMSLE